MIKIKRFAIYSKTLEAFYCPGKSRSGSMYRDELDFTKELESAYLYKNYNKAHQLALQLYYKFETLIVPVNMTLETEIPKDISGSIRERVNECQELVDRVNSLSTEETEALSKKEWTAFCDAKAHLRFVRNMMIEN